MAEIALTQSFNDSCSIPCSPDMKSCPVLRYHGKELDLPDSGTMTVRYKLKSETCNHKDNGEESYDYEIEILSILRSKSEDPKQPYSRDTSSEAALDALMEAKESE